MWLSYLGKLTDFNRKLALEFLDPDNTDMSQTMEQTDGSSTSEEQDKKKQEKSRRPASMYHKQEHGQERQC
jgi:hypothetical protein